MDLGGETFGGGESSLREVVLYSLGRVERCRAVGGVLTGRASVAGASPGARLALSVVGSHPRRFVRGAVSGPRLEGY